MSTFNFRIAVAVGLMATIGCAVAQGPADHAQGAPPLEAARAAYDEGHWLAAYQVFATAADQQNARASCTAWLMWRHGPRLYGQQFSATPDQLAHWFRRCEDLSGTKSAAVLPAQH